VAVSRRVRGGCRRLGRRGRLGRQVRPCSARRYLRARLARRRASGRFVRFGLRRRARLPAGRYLVASRARDRNGSVERLRPRRVRRFRIRP
jgi:hypothetical protein